MRRPAPAPVVALAAIALLAACHGKGTGTEISFNTDDGAGNIVADGGGSRANINLPGFSGTIKLPKIEVKADQVSLNGVHLYPGSAVSGMNVESHGEGEDNASARISFASPAAPATVRDWFQTRLNAAGYAVHPEGAGLVGKSNEGKPFRLELAPAGTGRTQGTIVSS